MRKCGKKIRKIYKLIDEELTRIKNEKSFYIFLSRQKIKVI